MRALNGRLSELTCLPTEEVSSLFTAAPRHAVVAFRKHSGLVADGAVGPITRAEFRTARLRARYSASAASGSR